MTTERPREEPLPHHEKERELLRMFEVAASELTDEDREERELLLARPAKGF